MANTDDANSLMHRTSNQRFSSLLIDTTPNKTENANMANGDESPFELTKDHLSENELI
jgi:hypothetical protein